MALDAADLSKCSCEVCGNHIEFPVSAAGDRVNCPHCRKLTRLVLPEADLSGFSSSDISAQLSRAFSGTMSRPRVSALYHLSLFLTAVLVVLLPICYVAIVSVLAFWLGHYAWKTAPMVAHNLQRSVQHYGLPWLMLHFFSLRRRTYGNGLRSVFFFGAVLLLGALVLFFMIKPLFRRRSRRDSAVSLRADLQPEFFAFVARLCQVIGAPMPQQIEVTCHPNASAELRRAGSGHFRQILVLRVGLPLAAALNARQFTGVLAHELAHFSQRSGLLCAYVIRAVRGWLTRVTSERDAWDEWLESRHSIPGILSFCAGALRFLIELCRFPLRVLLLIERYASGFLMRQMESYADGCEMQVVGSAVFEATTDRLGLLRRAFDRSLMEARATWNLGRRVPDNFPAFVQSNLQSIRLMAVPPNREKFRFFDTHPPDSQRIGRAKAAAAPGIVSIDLPANALLRDFEALARQASYAWYAEELGLVLESANLRSSAPAQKSAGT
jgi:hypothetical protein